jgi:hypothetical protein
MYGSNNMKKSVVFNGQFTPKSGGQFELESGGQFAPELVVNLHWNSVVNLTGFSTFSAPINSSFDDFGLVYKVSNGTGFLTSNRKEDNVGSDDVYEFSRFSIPTLEDLTVMIKSKKGNDVIGNTAVTLLNENNSILGTLSAINNKVSLLDADPSKGYNLQVNNENYEPYASSIKFEGTNTTTIYLTEKTPPPPPIDLQELLKLENIYFAFDKYAIRKDAAIELAKIVEILNKYPVIELDIVGHTDS